MFAFYVGPHLVIVPKSTLGNWEKEIERWCPEIAVVRFHGNQEERKDLRENWMMPGKFDVCLTSYEMVSKEKNLLSKFVWKYLIIDEAHRIKNENSVRVSFICSEPELGFLIFFPFLPVRYYRKWSACLRARTAF